MMILSGHPSWAALPSHLLQKQIPPRLPLLGLVLKSAKLFSMLFMPAKLPS